MIPRRWLWAGTAALVAVTLWATSMLLPEGYGTDLAQVGNGRAAVVLMHDDNLVASGQLMHATDRLRGDFEPEVQFLVADQVRVAGIEFAERHRLPAATLAVFGPDGELLGVYPGATRIDDEHLRRFIAERLPDRRAASE